MPAHHKRLEPDSPRVYTPIMAEHVNGYHQEPPELQPDAAETTRTGHAKRAKAMVQLLQLQHQAHQMAMNPLTPIKDCSALMRAWCDLQEEKRKLQMRPLPKPVDVSKDKRGRRQAGPSVPAYQEPDVAPELHTKPKPAQAPKPQG